MLKAKFASMFSKFTSGHEIAHMFGAHHDARKAVNRKFPYGLGKLIQLGKKRTIMA